MRRSIIPWVLDKIKESEIVDRIEKVNSVVYDVYRSGLPNVRLLISNIKAETYNDVEDQLSVCPDIDFVLNVPTAVYWSREAIGAVRQRGVGYGKIPDLSAAMKTRAIGDFVTREWVFIERGLKQSKAVEHFDCVAEGLYRIKRVGRRELLVGIIDEYEVTANAVRSAGEIFGEIDVVVNRHPLGRSTTAATAVASELGVELYDWRSFLERLRKD